MDKLNKTNIAEIAIGVGLALLIINLFSLAFSRPAGFHLDENAEDMENLRGRGRARRAARKETRGKKRRALSRRAQAQGEYEGSAGSSQWDESNDPVYDDQPGGGEGEEQEEYSLEEMEYFDNLSQEDVDNMDSAEYDEYLDYLDALEQMEQAA